MNSENRPLLVHIATVPEFFHSFFRGQLEFMKSQGFDVALICSSGETAQGFKDWPVRFYPIPILREISIFDDFVSLWRICRTIRAISPDIVHAHTSKAGILGIVAAWITGVPGRIFSVHGFRWVTKKGISRLLVKLSNNITCLLADRVLFVSKSLLDFGIDSNIWDISNAKVICGGSANGVDTVRFNPENRQEGVAVRNKFGIPNDSFVFGFVGRIVYDKGVEDLAVAWRGIRRDFTNTHLLLVGKSEGGDPLSAKTLTAFQRDDHVHLVGFAQDVVPYYMAMDVFVLPSHREGFAVTPIEASALCLPVIVTRIPGCIDGVMDNKTGLIVKRGDSTELEHAMRNLICDKRLCDRLGRAGREFVLHSFKQRPIWEGLRKEYRELLGLRPSRQTGLPLLIKRVTEYCAVIAALIIFSPVMAVVAILVWGNLGFPVIFREKRIGKGGKPFWFLKFRTMTNERDSEGNLLPDEKRLTLVGRFFRATSLDELPQLINVVKGEMSLVGPRPLPLKYLERFSDRQAIRHTVLPGITGLTATKYRGQGRTWDEKLENDVWYVENWSFLLDWKILFKTFWTTARKSFLNRNGETTSEEFRP